MYIVCIVCIKGNFSESFKPFSILKSTREEGVPEKSIKMMKANFTILFSLLIFITIINGKPFYRPMPGLIQQTLNKILLKQLNERFSTKSIVEPTNMPILILKTGKLPTVVLQSKSGFQLLTQLTESRQFKSTESTPNLSNAGPKSTVPQTKLPIILKSKSGFLTSPNFLELTETRKFSPEPTSNPKTSPIRSTTTDTQNDPHATESTKLELNSRKHQITRAKSEKLSVPHARSKLRKPKKLKKCHLQFFEKCNFDEWSRFLNSN